MLRADVESVLRTEKSEDGGQKEDGVQHPEDDDEKHDLEEGLEDVGGGGGEDDDAEEGGRGSVQDGCSGVSDGVLRSVLTRYGVGHQVSGTNVGREVDGETHAHDEMDHRDGGQRQAPEVHEAEDAHQDHDDGEDHQQDHEDVRQEEEGDDGHDCHSATHLQQGGGPARPGTVQRPRRTSGRQTRRRRRHQPGHAFAPSYPHCCTDRCWLSTSQNSERQLC